MCWATACIFSDIVQILSINTSPCASHAISKTSLFYRVKAVASYHLALAHIICKEARMAQTRCQPAQRPQAYIDLLCNEVHAHLPTAELLARQLA